MNESGFFYVKTMWFPFSISVVYAAPNLFKFTETKSNFNTTDGEDMILLQYHL